MASEPAPARLPDFFIVGHHKSGTTALYEMLRRHPRIFMPEMKEPEFYGRDLAQRAAAATAARAERRSTYAATRPHTLAQYAALFAPARADQLAGEASPSYLASASAAAQIAAAQPAARIVAILREPASFVHSLHLQLLQNHVQGERDLRRAIAAEEREGAARLDASERAEGPGAEEPPSRSAGGEPGYLARVRYVEQLRRYHEAFGRERVLVLIYDDFRADNVGAVREVLRFLEVDDTVEVQPLEANPTVAARSAALDRWTHAVKGARGPLARTVKAAVPQRLRRSAVSSFQRNVVYGAATGPDPRLMAELRERFREEVLSLSDYLDRDLTTLWGYERARSSGG